MLLTIAEIGIMADLGFSPGRLAAAVAVAIILVAVFRRYGVLAVASMTLFCFLALLAPLTLDASVWYFGRSLVVIVAAIAFAAYAFWISLAARPAFGTALLEED